MPHDPFGLMAVWEVRHFTSRSFTHQLSVCLFLVPSVFSGNEWMSTARVNNAMVVVVLYEPKASCDHIINIYAVPHMNLIYEFVNIRVMLLTSM